MKRKFAVLLNVMMIGIMGLAGCGQKEQAAEKVSLKIAMIGKDIKTACVIAAKELGYYEDENLEVTFETVNSLPDGLTAVSMGKLDILPYGVIPSCSFISQGTDVVIIGGTISEGSEGISATDETYTELSQFEGKKIGSFRMETGHMVLKGLLREAGVEAEFVYLDSQQSIVEAVKKGEVDLGMVNSGYGYVAKQGGAYVAFQVGDFVSDFPCCRQTTSRMAAEEKRDGLVRFEKAVLRAYETYLNDKETTITALAKYSGQERSYVEAVIYGTEDYDNAMVISIDPNKRKVADFYEIMKANGDIDAETKYDINDYIDPSIYEDALKALIEEEENEDIYEQLLEESRENNG